MSKNLNLSFAAGDYEMVRPLKEGLVQADGIDLTVLTSDSRERHLRMARNNEYDICEFNIYAYLIAKDQGYPLGAVPVFLHRRFRQGFIFVNPSKGITKPTDLIGKRVGTTNFQPAGNMWIRGILEEEYGVPHQSMTWVTDRDEDFDFEIPKGLKIERIKKSVEDALLAGEIDALVAPEWPRAFLDGDKRVARLFENYKEIEIDYFKRTGLFPIMHVTVVQQHILDQHPWVAASLMKAFTEAKQRAYRRVANPRVVPLAWFSAALEEQNALLGKDPWAFGLGEANRRNIDTIQRYALQQGIIRKIIPLEELFAHYDASSIRQR